MGNRAKKNRRAKRDGREVERLTCGQAGYKRKGEGLIAGQWRGGGGEGVR